MSAGDVLLFARPITAANFRRDPFGTAMCALIHLTTRSRYNHAALSLGPDDNGVELMVEATSKGITVGPVKSDDEITRIPLPAFADGLVPDFAYPACSDGLFGYYGNDLEEVLAWNTARVGWKYGYMNAAVCGLRSMWPGLQVKVGRQAICSEIVAESLERAGHDWGKDSALVSPGDVAEHFGVPR